MLLIINCMVEITIDNAIAEALQNSTADAVGVSNLPADQLVVQT